MLKYIIKDRKNPITSKVAFYAQPTTPDPLSIEQIARKIAQNCTLTRHDIVACLSAFQEQLINELQEGRSVRLGDLGSFRLTMKSKGTATAEEFSTANIVGVRIRFTPSGRLRRSLKVGAEGMAFALASAQSSGPGAGEPSLPEEHVPGPQDPGPESGGDPGQDLGPDSGGLM